MRKLLLGLSLLISAALPTGSHAQQWQPGGTGSPIVCAYNGTPPTISTGNFLYAQCTNNGSLQVNASVTATATISGFTPTPSYATGTTTASDQSVSLPTGTEFIVTNTGAAALAFNIGATATGTMNVLQPSSWIAIAGSAGAAFHYIEATGAATTSFSISGGAGLPTGAGGGSSSSSSGVAGWSPSFVYGATLAVGSTSSNEALPTGTVPGSSILIYNTGPSGVAYTLGPNNTVTAANNNDYLAANNQACINVPSSVGSAGFIAAKTFFTGIGAVSNINVSLGTGACSSTNSFQDFSVEIPGETAAFAHIIAGTDNSSATRFIGATAPGTPSTTYGMAVQGMTGGVPIPISGTFSAAGFTPAATASQTLSVTTAGQNIALTGPPAVGSTLIVTNNGFNQAFVNLETTAVAATINDYMVPPYSQKVFTIGTGQTFLGAITKSAGQTAVLNISYGSGSASDTGGPINTAIAPIGSTTGAVDTVGGFDNSGLSRALQATAPGTGATNFLLGIQGNPNGVPVPVNPIQTVSHASTTALAAFLSAKTTAGSLLGFNCTAITGGTAGFCVAYNATGAPGTGPLTGSLVLDFCQFDTTARGCSLGRAPTQVAYSAGIQILVTSAASPYTYTTGTDTAAVSADFQ